jgi:5,5'-dehydrodivanillate O-demethylase
MISAQENDLLTRIGPGTRMGNLFRRYWHPVSTLAEMDGRWTKKVRILGEDLVLYRNRKDEFGLIGEQCPHRRASMAYGIPTEDGIRCPYHGWKFDATGACTEQPNEPEGSTFKDKVSLPGYPVRELGGLLWTYMGPAPVPEIPRYDGFIYPNSIRMCGKTTIPCNWLQIMENSLDPVHTEWLHGKLYEFIREKDNVKVAIARHHVKIGFDEFKYGLIKRRLMEGQEEATSSDWNDGHPVVFPNILAVGSGGGLWHSFAFQIRVPIDDENTEHYWYNAFVPPAGAEVPQKLLDDVPVYDAPLYDERGEFPLEYIYAQDCMAWVTQGKIADRTVERLGTTDRGIVLLRKMYLRELEKIERGEDPICVLRDPIAASEMIDLPLEKGKDMLSDGFESMYKRNMASFAPHAQEVIDVFRKAGQARVAATAGD